MIYDGVVYRPPSEARSLIVQVTIGCAHNACTFCSMYKDKKFRVRTLQEIEADFKDAYKMYGDQIDRIFLADGDALMMDTEQLMEILGYIKRYFPSARRISSYATPKDVLQKSEEELCRLYQAGLTFIYMGAESGDERVLQEICKGVTAEEIAQAGKKLKKCGMKTSITLISGLGGKKRIKEHAIHSAELISEMKPDYVGFLTLMLDERAPIMKRIHAGEFELLSPEDVQQEILLFLQHVDSEGTVFRSNHASNYVMLAGTLNVDRERMIRQLEENERFRSERVRRL